MTAPDYTLLARTKILAALGITSVALIAATPASAIYRDAESPSDAPPVAERTVNSDDNSPKQGCTVNLQRPDGTPGQSVTYPHGYSFTVTNRQTGKKHTYTCNNGTWVETVSATGGGDSGYVYEADGAYVDDRRTVVIVSPHDEYSYSTSGGYSAA